MSNLIIISGPSGSGKSTLIQLFCQQFKELKFCVSHTTRKRRKGEVEGQDYYFISKNRFMEMIRNDEFAEWAVVHGNHYGTSKQEIQLKSQNHPLVINVDTQGARNLKKLYPDALYIFILPPSMKELKNRLLKREKTINESIKQRLKEATDEIRQSKHFDYIVLNDNIQKALAKIGCIYTAHKVTAQKMRPSVEKILGGSR